MISTSLLITFVFAATEASALFCDISKVTLDLGTLTPQKGVATAIAMGVGNQIYDCVSGSFVNTGASAILYDMSCKPDVTNMPSIQDDIEQSFDVWSNADSPTVSRRDDPRVPTAIMTHFFQEGLPAFSAIDITGDANEYFVGNKTSSVPSPDGADNVAWLQLTNATSSNVNGNFGKLAGTVFRTHTVGGSVPADSICTSGANSTKLVKYAALYSFWNGSVLTGIATKPHNFIQNTNNIPTLSVA